MLRIAIQSKGLLRDIGIDVDVPKRKLLSKSQSFPLGALYLRDDDSHDRGRGREQGRELALRHR